MHLTLALVSALSLAFAATTDPDAKPHAGGKSSDAKHWSYSGEGGPENWHKVAPEFAACSAGHMQSPIDLGTPNARAAIAVHPQYRAGPLNIVNNGHTVQANFAAGSTLASGGTSYGLLQVHFHTPSEHAVSGQRYPLVAHFVHKSDAGALAVLAVFFEEGAANPELGKLIAAAPTHHSEAHDVAGVTFDANGMLPANLDVFRYMGSLTTPPCSEGVNWHLAATPVTASAEQIGALHAIMGDNARPVQPLHNRLLVAR